MAKLEVESGSMDAAACIELSNGALYPLLEIPGMPLQTPVFQPIYETASNQAVAHELLLRSFANGKLSEDAAALRELTPQARTNLDLWVLDLVATSTRFLGRSAKPHGVREHRDGRPA